MVFKTVESDITKSGTALSIFNKDMSLFIKNWNNTQGLKNRVQSAFTNPNIITEQDLVAIKKYNQAISTGTSKQAAFYKYLNNSSIAVQNLASNAKYGTINTDKLTISTQTLTFAQKASAAASQVMGVALSMALNLGIGLIISAIIAGITKLVNQMSELQDKIDDLIKLFERGDHYDCIIKNRLYHIIIVQPIVFTTYIHNSCSA